MLHSAGPRLAARLACLVLLATPIAVHAQSDAASPAETPIRAGAPPVQRTLGGTARHVFTLDVPARTFVSGAVVQQSVDAVVEVLGADGVRLASFDGPARGPEVFTFTAPIAGRYRIAVRAFEGASGRVTVAVDRAEPVATTPAGRADQLFADVARPDVPATVVRLSQGGRVVYERAWGAADLALGVPATTGTRVNIASVSKQFTAFALASLAADGRLSLDDSLRRWLPEMPVVSAADGGPVTLRHLLTHTSGLREILNARLLTGWNLGDRLGEGAALALASRQASPQNRPGAGFNYNNTGYMLAATAAARATGTPFPDWMQAHIFAPLGMMRTSVVTEAGQVVPEAAQGYSKGRTGFVATSGIDHGEGATGIVTTAADLDRWLSNMGTGRVGGEALRAIQTRAITTGGDTLSYGLGLFVGRDRGQRLVGHGGAEGGSSSYIGRYPDLDVNVVVLASVAGYPAEVQANALVNAFFADRFEAAPATAATPGAVDFEPARFDGLAGVFALAPTFRLTFTRESADAASADAAPTPAAAPTAARYFVQATGQPRFEIFPSSDSTFFLTVVPASATFHRDADGRAERLTWHQGGQNVPAARVAAYTPTADVLARYAGRYASAELGVVYTLSVEDGVLTVRSPVLPASIVLTPSAEGVFTSSGVLGEVRFDRDASGAPTAFRVFAGRILGLAFDRID